MVVNGLTAYQMLHGSAKVRAGQTVLVLGASGGVGTILVQLARLAGVRVIGTASPRHHEALRALGAEPIDYHDSDLAARVRELTPGGVDAVFDHLDDKTPVLLTFMVLLTKLAYWNYLPTGKHASFYNVWSGAGKPGSVKRAAFVARIRNDLTPVLGLLRDGKLTARIAARYPLTEVAAAMELSESSSRTALGKIILVP